MTQPFHFSNGQAANNVQDLMALCKQYPDEARGYLVRQDLESWLTYIGNNDFAECAANARQIDAEDRQKLEEFLNRCNFLTAPKSMNTAVTTTKIEDNPTAPESIATTTNETPQEKVFTIPDPAISKSLVVETAPKQPVAKPKTVTVTKQPVAKTAVNSSSSKSSKKPSFFHVVAKFIVSILYQNKA